MDIAGIPLVSPKVVQLWYMQIDRFFWVVLVFALIYWVLYIKWELPSSLESLFTLFLVVSGVTVIYLIGRVSGQVGKEYPLYGTAWMHPVWQHISNWFNNI